MMKFSWFLLPCYVKVLLRNPYISVRYFTIAVIFGPTSDAYATDIKTFYKTYCELSVGLRFKYFNSDSFSLVFVLIPLMLPLFFHNAEIHFYRKL